MSVNYIVFYGTLMKKSTGGVDPRELTYVRDVMIPGKMYSVHNFFPAVVMGEGSVCAELYELPDAPADYDAALDRLDGYEGHNGDKEGDLYTRTIVYIPEVGDYAWMYTFNSNPSHLEPIEHGDWIRFVGPTPQG